MRRIFILERTQKDGLDVTAWMDWFLGCLGRAIDGADTTLGAVLVKARFWDRVRGVPLNERQTLVLNRLLDGFDGKLTTSKYARLTKSSPDTALRDITALVDRGILVRSRPVAGARAMTSRRAEGIPCRQPVASLACSSRARRRSSVSCRMFRSAEARSRPAAASATSASAFSRGASAAWQRATSEPTATGEAPVSATQNVASSSHRCSASPAGAVSGRLSGCGPAVPTRAVPLVERVAEKDGDRPVALEVRYQHVERGLHELRLALEGLRSELAQLGKQDHLPVRAAEPPR